MNFKKKETLWSRPEMLNSKTLQNKSKASLPVPHVKKSYKNRLLKF